MVLILIVQSSVVTTASTWKAEVSVFRLAIGRINQIEYLKLRGRTILSEVSELK